MPDPDQAVSACTVKVRYPSARFARDAVKERRKAKGKGYRVHAYHCEVCDGYHLTSMNGPREENAAAARARREPA